MYIFISFLTFFFKHSNKFDLDTVWRLCPTLLLFLDTLWYNHLLFTKELNSISSVAKVWCNFFSLSRAMFLLLPVMLNINIVSFIQFSHRRLWCQLSHPGVFKVYEIPPTHTHTFTSQANQCINTHTDTVISGLLAFWTLRLKQWCS